MQYYGIYMIYVDNSIFNEHLIIGDFSTTVSLLRCQSDEMPNGSLMHGGIQSVTHVFAMGLSDTLDNLTSCLCDLLFGIFHVEAHFDAPRLIFIATVEEKPPSHKGSLT